MNPPRLFPCLLAALGLGAARAPTQPPAAQPDEPRPKNIILLVADGAGYNMLQATRLWTGEPLAMDGSQWAKLGLATYALRSGKAFREGLDLGPSLEVRRPRVAHSRARDRFA